jgi:hypothetical protein
MRNCVGGCFLNVAGRPEFPVLTRSCLMWPTASKQCNYELSDKRALAPMRNGRTLTCETIMPIP